MQESLVFELQSLIKVHLSTNGNNEFVEIDKIYLKAPTYKQKDITIRLKKKFIEAIFAMTNSLSQKEAQSAVGDDEKSDLDAKSIKAVLFAAKDFDIVDFFKSFENLLFVVAFKNEEMTQALNKSDISKIAEDDFESLVAKYIEVFFIASWMKTLS